MEQLKEQFKKSGTLHHAYIIEGDREKTREKLASFFEKDLALSLAGNPDYWCRKYDTFGIDEARELKERQTRASFETEKSAQKGRKIFVVCAERMTGEAQNALLKVLEEPTTGTHIFIVMPDVSAVLPTVRSRAVLLRGARALVPEEARAFLLAPYHAREKIIGAIVEAEEAKERRVLPFLQGLESLSMERYTQLGDVAAYRTSLEALYKCRTYISGRAPSVKMLMEYLSLVLPRQGE